MPDAEESAHLDQVADSAAAGRAPSGGTAASPGSSASPAAAKPAASSPAASSPAASKPAAANPAASSKPAASSRKSRVYRIGGGVLSAVVILFIFLGVIPQFANYREAWAAIAKMSPGWWVAIAVAAVINLAAGVWGFQAALPRLRYRHGFMEAQTSTAVATTVPAGGALALGLTYRMFGSFGFSNVAISTAVVITGVWNLGAKFGLPIVAVALLAVTGQRTGGVVGVALGGVLVMVVSGIVLWLVFRDEASARWVGRLGDRVLNWLLHLVHKPGSNRVEHAVLHFRDQTIDIARQRGWLLTGAVLASQLALFVLVLFCARAAGIAASQVSFLEILLSFSIARLAGALPITPGGLGSVDAAFTGMLIAFGAKSSDALAADLMWRATTYFPPIFIGIATYLIWRRGLVKGTYQEAPDAAPSAIALAGEAPVDEEAAG